MKKILSFNVRIIAKGHKQKIDCKSCVLYWLSIKIWHTNVIHLNNNVLAKCKKLSNFFVGFCGWYLSYTAIWRKSQWILPWFIYERRLHLFVSEQFEVDPWCCFHLLPFKKIFGIAQDIWI